MSSARKIDLTGMKCPMPIIKLNQLLKEVGDGEEFVATADDPAFCLDVEAWCRRVGSDLVSCQDSDGKMTVVIRKHAA